MKHKCYFCKNYNNQGYKLGENYICQNCYTPYNDPYFEKEYYHKLWLYKWLPITENHPNYNLIFSKLN